MTGRDGAWEHGASGSGAGRGTGASGAGAHGTDDDRASGEGPLTRHAIPETDLEVVVPAGWEPVDAEPFGARLVLRGPAGAGGFAPNLTAVSDTSRAEADERVASLADALAGFHLVERCEDGAGDLRLAFAHVDGGRELTALQRYVAADLDDGVVLALTVTCASADVPGLLEELEAVLDSAGRP